MVGLQQTTRFTAGSKFDGCQRRERKPRVCSDEFRVHSVRRHRTTTNAGVLGASVSLSGASVGLGGSTLPLTGSVSNTATSPAYTINWDSSSVPTNVTLTPASGTGVAVGTPVSLTGSVALPAADFGPWSSVVTFTGTDSNSTVSANVTQTLNYSIIGKGTYPAAGGDRQGVFGTYGGTLSTVAGTTNLAGLVSTMGTSSSSFGIGNTTATILAGVTSATTVTEAWRGRASSETAIGAGELSPRASHCSATWSAWAASAPAPLRPTSCRCPTTRTRSTWERSMAKVVPIRPPCKPRLLPTNSTWATMAAADWGNAGTPGSAGYQGSYASFTANTNGFNGSNLGAYLGDWGVDTANNVVWAIVDKTGEFAAVPEPGTLALLAAGVAALGIAYRRRKVAKA